MNRLIEDTDNGSELLKEEIKRSDQRVRAAKTGNPLNKIVPEYDINFFTPDLETYFTGKYRVLRQLELSEQPEEEHKDVKFFVT